jgi:hypothetical protein
MMHVDPHIAAVIHQSRATEMQRAAERARLVSRLAARTRSTTPLERLSTLAKKVKPPRQSRTTQHVAQRTGSC